jgi:hypothetical protein
MIVSVVSMPEGTVTSASMTEARQLLATGSFVVVDVEQPERPTPDDQGVEDLEDEMFEHRRQQQLHRLALLRRRLALLHRTVLPYTETREELVTLMAVRHDIADDRKALVDRMTVM